MNPQPETSSDALRSEINTTRDRMDHTLDALGNRLDGRHLVDELMGFFRGRAGDMGRIRDQVSRTAGTAVSSVVDTVKAHPVPALMAGVGIAWLIYETTTARRESRRSESEWDDDVSDAGERGFSTADEPDYQTEGEGPSAGYKLEENATGMAAQAKGKVSELGAQAREKASHVVDRARETLESAKDRVGEVAGQVQQRSRELYGRTRERVAATANEHPLEVGLGFLAAGFLVALAIPTPDIVNRRVGPMMDRLKDRTRAAGAEAVDKGKRVVQAATNAGQEEARKQGLTLGADGEHAEDDQHDQLQNTAMGSQPTPGGGPQTGAARAVPNAGADGGGPSQARTAS